MTINKHQTSEFLGNTGFPLFAVRYDPGVARRLLILQYYATVSKVTGKFLSLFELFEACFFVLRQRTTATVSIQFSKEAIYSTQKEEASPI